MLINLQDMSVGSVLSFIEGFFPLVKHVVGATKYFNITVNYGQFHRMLNYYFLRSCFHMKLLPNDIFHLNIFLLIIVNIQLFFLFGKT